MQKDKLKKMAIVLLAAVLLCAGCGKTKATTMSLMKTEGTVDIDDDKGKRIEPVNDLKLYSGYDMLTKDDSYAWINLDRVKLTKMDEKSEIEIQKDGKDLKIQVNSGSFYFHVAEALEDDETMEIRTSTMAVGIRGTCGWVSKEDDSRSQVYILEGTVIVQTEDGQTAEVRAGQKAEVTVNEEGKTEITVSEFAVSDIPEFIMADIVRDDDLCKVILEASGLDVKNPATDDEPATEAYDAVIEEYQSLLADIRNLAGDGEIGYENWDYTSYEEKYPDTSSWYMPYIYNDRELYHAYHDLDGNGTKELIIGYHEDATDEITPISIHTFDGSKAITMNAFMYELLGDGLLLETGNGYVSGRVYQISSDGCTWEETGDSGIARGVDVRNLDLSAHGGFLRDTLDWTVIH